MFVQLLLLVNFAIVANCQSTMSGRNYATCEYEQCEDMKSEIKSMRQLLMNLQQATVRSETQARQRLKTEINEMRETMAQQQFWSINECPPGFRYLPESRSCYKVIFERMTWDNATERCRQMMPGVHLAAITSLTENNAIVGYLQSQFRGGNNSDCSAISNRPTWHKAGNVIWIGGQMTRTAPKCGDSYAWRPLRGIDIPFEYANWIPNQPDCYRGGEGCVHITTGLGYQWNNYRCDWLSCAICELHV